MTSGRAPRNDDRSGKGHGLQEPGGSAFGPQGAALLGELRRIQGVIDRGPDGGSRASPSYRSHGEAESAASFIPRKRPASSDQRNGMANGAVGAWLEHLEADDDASDNRVGRPRPENAHPRVKSNPSILRIDAKARRPTQCTGETPGIQPISNILDLRMSELRPSRGAAERRLQRRPPTDPPARSDQRDAVGAQARRASVGVWCAPACNVLVWATVGWSVTSAPALRRTRTALIWPDVFGAAFKMSLERVSGCLSSGLALWGDGVWWCPCPQR